MSLSQWDLDNLSQEDQGKVQGYKDLWNSDPSQRQSAHNAAEGLRKKYGYSGDNDGSQYNPFGIPTIPQIPEYESKYEDQFNELFDQIKNPPKYESPYGDLLNQSISDIQNRPAHSYDPDSDPAYQAFIQRATRAGDKAYADNLGGMSAMTGGRPNSWAGTVASQARNAYTLQAQEAVIQFEERSYNRYQDETTNMYNFVNLLQTQDITSYNRYRDQIGDTKDLANMVMDLDARDYDRFKDMAEQSWKVFDAESQQYQDALQEKKDKIAEARDRTDLTGFVNNQDAITLGVPTGTLSKAARERIEVMEDYVTKQGHDFENFKKEKEVQHGFDVKLLKARETIDTKAATEAHNRNLSLSYSTGTTGTGEDYRGLGSIAGKYESNGNPGTVSSGKGDHGGVSYGIYQFSSNTGGAASFVNFLKKNNTEYYNELSKAGKPGSASFGAAWKKIADRDPDGFARLQQQAIQQTHYDPAVASVRKATGINVNERSPALQEAIWSTAVQHGGGAVAKIVQRALNNSPSGKNDDAALIAAIYDERGANNGGKYFPSSSKNVQQSVANRFKKEKADVLALYSGGGKVATASGGSSTEFTNPDITKINKANTDFTKLVESKDFTRLSASEKAAAIKRYEDNIVNSVDKGLYGKNSLAIGQEIVSQMLAHPAYKKSTPIDPQLKNQMNAYNDKIMTPGFSIHQELMRR